MICKCRASFQSSREQEKAAFICLNGDKPSLSRGRKTYINENVNKKRDNGIEWWMDQTLKDQTYAGRR